MFKRISTKKEFNAFKHLMAQATEVNAYVSNRKWDYCGNRTAHVRVCFSGDFGTIEYAPRNRQQTGCAGHRANAATYAIRQAGLSCSKLENAAKEHQAFNENGVSFNFYVASEVL